MGENKGEMLKFFSTLFFHPSFSQAVLLPQATLSKATFSKVFKFCFTKVICVYSCVGFFFVVFVFVFFGHFIPVEQLSISPLPSSGNYHSVFWFSEFDCFRYLMRFGIMQYLSCNYFTYHNTINVVVNGTISFFKV